MVDQKWKSFSILSGLLFTLLLMVSYVDATINDDVAGNLPQVIQPIDLNRSFTWAGELVPNTFDAQERLDRELSVNAYWHSSTIQNIKLAYKYFPTIERILAEQGVPDDFKYLAVAESGLRNVVSSASAAGFWQFRKLAAKEFKLEVNSEVDERYHLEKATLAAAQYLKQLHKRFGNWTSAAASYNVGPTAFRSIMRKQKEDSYYDLNLNSETSRYVFRLIAMKELMSRPNDFGFYISNTEKYYPMDNYHEVEVTESIPSLPDFAKSHGITYRMLKVFNPWLVDTELTVKHNTYRIKIPR